MNRRMKMEVNLRNGKQWAGPESEVRSNFDCSLWCFTSYSCITLLFFFFIVFMKQTGPIKTSYLISPLLLYPTWCWVYKKVLSKPWILWKAHTKLSTFSKWHKSTQITTFICSTMCCGKITNLWSVIYKAWHNYDSAFHNWTILLLVS